MQHFKFAVLCFAMAASSVVPAQDIHFTQFEYSPLAQNPAFTNLFDGDMRFGGIFKNQWQSVPVAYNTGSASMDMNFVTLKNHDRIGGGLLFYYDQAGDSKFMSLNVAYSMSYQLNFGRHDEHILSLGVNAGFVNRSFDYTKLFFDNQFSGDAFVSSIPASEIYNRTNFFFFDMGAGLAYKWNKGLRDNFTIGFNVAHINMPNQSFYGDNTVKLLPRLNLNIQSELRISAKCDIMPAFLWQMQGPKMEFVPGLTFKTFVSATTYARVALNTGIFYRVNDAPSVLVGMDYNNFQLNCSYDINTSNFTPASRYNGGIEISLVYIIKRIKKLHTFANCPIF